MRGWYVPAAAPGRPVVVIAHGLGSNRGDSLLPAILLRRSGLGALVFDFRGQGESEGAGIAFGRTEAEDLAAAHGWVRTHAPSSPVYALGYSLGGAGVLRAAARLGIFEKVAVGSTFGRLERVVREVRLRPLGPAAGVGWQLFRLWGWVLRGYDFAEEPSEELVQAIAPRPVLFIHGTVDTVIPSSESEHLARRAGRHGELCPVPGAEHVGAIERPDCGERLRAFFEGEPPRAGALP